MVPFLKSPFSTENDNFRAKHTFDENFDEIFEKLENDMEAHEWDSDENFWKFGKRYVPWLNKAWL